MTGGMAMFQSELRSAVREVREAPGAKAEARPAPKLAAPAPKAELTEAYPRPPSTAHKRTVVRLWLPLTPLWVLLAPFALLLAPLLMLAPRMLPEGRRGRRLRGALAVRHPFRTAFALGAVLFALSGTVVDVDAPDALVRIRIF